ncbi:MAG: hypothetical protein JWL95_1680 [Gemmatimonadetes bacterium]|nr:hypothetical protein [Gemmatimonadota bacterium]
MPVEMQSAQDPGFAKIRALLLAARADLAGDVRDISQSVRQKSHGPKGTVPDRSAPIEKVRKKVEALRAKVEGTAVTGTAAVSARDLTVRALRENEQALAKLAASYAAPDQSSSTALVSESVRLMNESKATSVRASKALGIPWPLQ